LKKYLFLFIFLILSCSSGKEKMNVNVTIDGFKKGNIYLQKIKDSVLINVDSTFIENKIETGRFQSTSEAIRAGLSLLEEQEVRLDILRAKLAIGDSQLDQGQGVDGQSFMEELIK